MPRRQRHNAYRDGKVHVCQRQCPTCIFRPGNKMHLDPGRLKQMTDGAVKNDSCIICHDTLDGDNAVCRGFFNKHRTTPLQIAERIEAIMFVMPEKKS